MIKLKKTSKVSDQQKTPRCRRFYGVVFSVILVFGLFNGFLVKNVLASNDYVDKVEFIGRAGDNVALLQFHVKTTFYLTSRSGYFNEGAYYQFCALYPYTGGGSGYYSYYYLNENLTSLALLETTDNGALMFPSGSFPSGYCGTATFEAGHTYEIPLSPDYWDSGTGYGRMYGYWAGGYASQHGHYTTLTTSDYLNTIFGATPAVDTGTYFFHQLPTLSITYPHNNDEIAGAFDIQGSYTMPSSAFNQLYVAFEPTLSGFYQNITGTAGDVLIPVSDLPAGDYTLKFYFYLTGEFFNAYEYPLSINVKIVNDIPPALPTGETPPTIPIYPPTAPDTYHADYCAYGTSTTPLFNTLTGAVSGIVSNVGQNLADFAGKFSLTDARYTGEQLAGSVLTMRAYVAGLNSFFGDLPIGQILVLYLVVFVLVILFRVIKGLINLIKP